MHIHTVPVKNKFLLFVSEVFSLRPSKMLKTKKLKKRDITKADFKNCKAKQNLLLKKTNAPQVSRHINMMFQAKNLANWKQNLAYSTEFGIQSEVFVSEFGIR